jgi:hypothetical protein
VSRICGGLDEHVEALRSRPLEGRHPYLFVDAKVEKVRDGGRVARKCVVIALLHHYLDLTCRGVEVVLWRSERRVVAWTCCLCCRVSI